MKSLHLQPFAPTIMFGALLILAGVGGAVYLTIAVEEIDAAFTLHRLTTTAALAGLALMLYAGIRRKGRSIEEAYRLGYDVGFENGHRAGVLASEAERVKLAAQRREHSATVDTGVECPTERRTTRSSRPGGMI